MYVCFVLLFFQYLFFSYLFGFSSLNSVNRGLCLLVFLLCNEDGNSSYFLYLYLWWMSYVLFDPIFIIVQLFCGHSDVLGFYFVLVAAVCLHLTNGVIVYRICCMMLLFLLLVLLLFGSKKLWLECCWLVGSFILCTEFSVSLCVNCITVKWFSI